MDTNEHESEKADAVIESVIGRYVASNRPPVSSRSKSPKTWAGQTKTSHPVYCIVTTGPS
jgi:hypothetical protein